QQGVVAEGAPQVTPAGEHRGRQLSGIVHHGQLLKSVNVHALFPPDTRYCYCRRIFPQEQVVDATSRKKPQKKFPEAAPPGTGGFSSCGTGRESPSSPAAGGRRRSAPACPPHR